MAALVALVVALSMAAAGCAGGSDSGSTGAGPSLGQGMPAAEVVDLADGATVDLADYGPGDKPLLIWFWAPF